MSRYPTVGYNVLKDLSVGTTLVAVKTSPGMVTGLFAHNSRGSLLHLKFYDTPLGEVVLGTDPPSPYLTIPIESGRTKLKEIRGGLRFLNAITVACTVSLADNATDAPAANELVVDIFYV